MLPGPVPCLTHSHHRSSEKQNKQKKPKAFTFLGLTFLICQKNGLNKIKGFSHRVLEPLNHGCKTVCLCLLLHPLLKSPLNPKKFKNQWSHTQLCLSKILTFGTNIFFFFLDSMFLNFLFGEHVYHRYQLSWLASSQPRSAERWPFSVTPTTSNLKSGAPNCNLTPQSCPQHFIIETV